MSCVIKSNAWTRFLKSMMNVCLFQRKQVPLQISKRRRRIKSCLQEISTHYSECDNITQMIPPVSLKWYRLRHFQWYRSYHSNDTAYDTLMIPLQIVFISLKWYHPYHSNSTGYITQMIPMYFIQFDCVISTCEHCRSLLEFNLCQTVTFLWWN